jgi:hypothetical protein
MRRFGIRYRLLALTVMALGIWAAALDLHTFQPGTVIRSAEVNENFEALAEALRGKQTRVTDACPGGASIRVIHEDGSVGCHVDQVGDGSEAGVAALNGMTGSVVLQAGSNISIDDSADGQIVIAAVGGDDGGLTAVTSDGTLTGDGTASAPLGLADGAVTAANLADFGASTGQVLKYDGSAWTAGNDENTTYTAGDGLVLSGTRFSLDTAVTDARYLALDTNGGFAAAGEVGGGAIAAEGAGTRLLWYPGKSAFRVGRVSGSEWNDAAIGSSSVAMGEGTTASGTSSTAIGRSTTADGIASTAMGNVTTASGTSSTSMGWSTTASGNTATAMGWNTFAGGGHSTAMNSETTASGESSTAMGRLTMAAGRRSVAMGLGTRALANEMVAIGRYNAPTGVADSSAPDRPAFVVGNGTGDANRSHALLLLANGDLRITGPMRVGSFPSSTGTGVCRTTNGTLASCSSSARYKEEILDVDPRAAADLVEQLRPVSFRWQDSGLEDLGLIAEELAELEPRLVTFDAAGEIEGIKYNHLSALLVAALQDLQAHHDDATRAQQARIAALSEQLTAQREAFEERLAALEQLVAAASPE